MANSDYSLVSSGAFCPMAVLAYPVSHLEPTFVLTDVREPATAPISVGMVGLIGREFVQVTAVTLPSITVKRGCGDTVPWTHNATTPIFFISGYTAVHRREFLGTEKVSIKALAKTNAGRVPVEYAPPNEVQFNLRFARPYPPAQFKTNGSAWNIGKYITPSAPLVLTWVDRNRLVQADQMLGHNDAGVTPEAGTTYRLRLAQSDGTVVRTVTGITGNTFTYTLADAVIDFALTPGTGEFEGRMFFGSVRDGLVCWQEYSAAFRIDRSVIPGGLVGSYMAMESGGRVLTEDGSRIVLE